MYRCPSRRKKTWKPRNRDETKNDVSTLDSESDGGDLLFSAYSGSGTEADAWIVDSGASRHMAKGIIFVNLKLSTSLNQLDLEMAMKLRP